MLKKTITYTNFDDQQVTEDFYFNISKAEIAEMELSQEGGMAAHIQRIVTSKNQKEILEEFKKIILMSVGKRSEDGRRFIKSQEIIDDFVQTNAYSELFVELAMDEKAAAEFIQGIVPAGMAEQIAKKQANPDLPTDIKILPAPEEKADPKPWVTENREPTKDELKNMSKEDLVEVMQRKMQS